MTHKLQFGCESTHLACHTDDTVALPSAELLGFFARRTEKVDVVAGIGQDVDYLMHKFQRVDLALMSGKGCNTYCRIFDRDAVIGGCGVYVGLIVGVGSSLDVGVYRLYVVDRTLQPETGEYVLISVDGVL